MNEINLDQVIKDFATDVLNTILFILEQPYTSASNKRFKGLDNKSTLYNSINVITDVDGTIVIDAPLYFGALDKGRKAGTKKIPYQIILRWLKKKNIFYRQKAGSRKGGQFKAGGLNTLAWIIQKSIYKIGIRPRNIIARTFIELDDLYSNRVDKGIDKIIDQMFKNVIDDIETQFKPIQKNTIKG
jgi:hypothetical protein